MQQTSLFLYICRVNQKWYIPLLVVVFLFVGASGVDSSGVDPNQEIVVAFHSDATADDAVAQTLIAELTTQLEVLGAKNIHVSVSSSGKLSIRYYSAVDAGKVKAYLAKHDFTLPNDWTPIASDNLPVKSTPDSFEWAVVTIQKDSGTDNALQGTFVEVNSLQDQFLKPKISLAVHSFSKSFSWELMGQPLVPCFYTSKKQLIRAYEIPEIRAGPMA